jgi:uncharacterized membrane protein YdcZ (DUF606 family)
MTSAYFYILPIIAAIGAVFQPILNEAVSRRAGNIGAIFWNGIIFGVFSTLFFLASKWMGPSLPEILRVKSMEFEPFYIVAGFCGVLIVSLLPPAIPTLGVSTTLILFIVTQLVLSTLVDKFMGRDVDLRQWLGVLLAVAGAYLVTAKK